MDGHLFERTKAFLIPYFEADGDRRTYVETALRGCPGIDGRVDWAGNAANFTHNLVTLLVDTYGDCGDTPAIVRVLREVSRYQGTDVQADAEKLIAEITGDETRVVAGRYKLLRQIGDESGQGDVYHALDTNDPEGLPAVVKLFKPHPTRDYETRFMEEVRSVRALRNHNHIIEIWDFGVDGDTPYLVMPVMSGSLTGRLDGALAPDEALGYLGQIADALDFAHAHGVIHRDLKPANFLFTPETDLLCLSDFGISYRADRAEGVTGVQEIVGTEEYAAPEQLRGEAVTPQTDIYALAIIAYELLTGVRPFTGSKAEMLACHLNEPLPANDHALFKEKPFVLDVLRKGAAKNPEDRPETATAFVAQLGDALAGKAPEAIEHYLSETLPRHILEVGSISGLGLLDKAFVELSADVRQQQVMLPEYDPVLDDPDLDVGDELGLDFDFDDEPGDPPPMELSGAAYAPREHGTYTEPEYKPDVREHMKTLRRVVLLGAPGAGKTFTLARLALDYRDAYRADPTQQPLPVFVPLSTYNTDANFGAFVRGRLDGLALDEVDVIWLLDALNEMPRDRGQLRHLKAFIRELVERDTPFVLTCRVRNYNEDLHDVPDLYRVDLQDLNPQQVFDVLAHFVRESYAEQVWAGVMYGVYTDYRDRKTNLLDAWAAWGGSVYAFWQRPKRTSNADDTKEAHLRARDHIHRDPRKLMLLCRNPFTLVRLLVPRIRAAVKHAQKTGRDLTELLEKALPNNRAQLFGQMIDGMLSAEAERRGWTDADQTAIKSVLEFTAAALQATQQRTEMPLAALRGDANAPDDLDERLRMARDAGLVTLSETTVRFNHQLYQEYFATAWLRGLLADYDRRYPGWEDGEPLPPRDERLSELFPDWWDVGGWRVTVALLGELEGRVGVSRVVRWLASYTPSIALEILVGENNDGLTVPDLTETAQQALMAGARARLDEPNPVGRAAAYRVLGHPDIDADKRPGVGNRIVTIDGEQVEVPDIMWAKEVPAGTYTIGGDEKAYDGLNQGVKAGTYTVEKPFRLATYLVTYRQFQAFLDAPDGFDNDAWWVEIPDEYKKQSMKKQNNKHWNHPRTNVSWYQAVAFCRWLTDKYRKAGLLADGQEIRLPHEYEWEAAARGDDGRFFPYGNEYDPQKANVGDTSINQMSAVGVFPAGAAPCGALDMSGNVFEWCANKYRSPDEVGVDNSGDARVVRGGAFNYRDDLARCAYRDYVIPSSGDNDLGLRVCCGAPY